MPHVRISRHVPARHGTLVPVGLLVVAFLLSGCTPEVQESTPSVPQEAAPVTDALDRGLDAHGGLDTWRQYGTLEFDLQRGESSDHQVVDLQDRRVYITSDAYTLGFDGEDVWITPEKEALDYGPGPRFYSGTYFYFFAIPFVLADPGVNREVLGKRTLGEKTYDVVKLSYDAGVGDSPDDNYVVYFDEETHQMHLVLYTVTYFRGEPSERYSALMYDEWQEVGGLRVPHKATYYRWENDALGEKRNELAYTNVQFRRERPDPDVFTMPEGAVVDEAPTEEE